MGALLLAAVLATAPPAATAAPPQTAAVFVHPLTSAALAIIGHAFCVSAGVQVVQSERWSLTSDLAFVYGPGDNPSPGENFPGGTSISGSLGPTWRISGTGLRGLFVTPKLYVIASQNSQRSGRPGSREFWFTGEVGGAVDLAFQWTFGRFFLGSVLGLGGGWAFGPSRGQPTTSVSTFGGAVWGDSGGPSRASGPVLSLNVQLLRVGMTF